MSITGNEITSAQQMTCHPPIFFARFAPSAYPNPHSIIAQSIYKIPKKLCVFSDISNKIYKTTNPLPNNENSQNVSWGRSFERRTANMAVHKGSNPINTIEKAALICCSANAVNNGNPTTTPTATYTKFPQSRFDGRLAFKIFNKTIATIPAMTARIPVKNQGLKSITAIRVAGKDPEKITTPIKPLNQAKN